MIRIDSIEINRFRGIREGAVRNLGDVNILIGRNNSGKSTVAEAISWATEHIGNVDPLQRSAMDIWTQVRNLPTNSELWYRQDRSEQVSVTVRIGGATLVRQMEPLAGGSFKCEPEVQNQHSDPVYQFIRSLTVFRPLDCLNQEIERKLWPMLLANRRDKALTQTLNDIFKLDSEGFQLLPDQRLLVMFPEYSVPIDVQGDGTRSALRCLMMLAALRNTLFVIEEPESHQHPGSLERFAHAVCGQAKRQEVQLLISTHSAECVRSFLSAAEAAGSESAVFHLQREDGVLEANRLDAETVQTLQATGVDVRYLDLYA